MTESTFRANSVTSVAVKIALNISGFNVYLDMGLSLNKNQ
jgi:hypothetical protein